MNQKKKKKQKNRLQTLFLRSILLLSLATAGYSGYRMLGILREGRQSDLAAQQLIDSAVSPVPSPDEIPNTDEPTVSYEEDSSVSSAADDSAVNILDEFAPIEVDFQILRQENPDIQAWIYSPDTKINYPVVQSGDNSYYLKRLIDGSYNPAGTLFLDYQCSSDLSDNYSLIYGHNMNNGSMFGTLTKYKNESYYEDHPYIYLITPDTSYRLDLLAGYTTNAISETYQFPKTEEEIQQLLSYALANSTFTTQAEIPQANDAEDHYLALSTCSYEYDEARYVLIGRLRKLKSN